ncbi:MAG: Zn-dependent hydrolase [Gemmatimonadetes bacterium]|nr:Zn-dependent hydrolase [Gemmatimonadota bacterium]
MHRRRFTSLTGTVLVGLALPYRSRAAAFFTPRGRQAPRVDGPRLLRRLQELSRFGRNAAGGIDRVAFSDADIQAREWLKDLMRDAGLQVVTDEAGNLVGRRGGTDTSGPPIVLGSHVDSVPNGGTYDGQVGLMGMLEVATTLDDAGISTRHPLEFVVFTNEEDGKTGSRALAGEVDPSEMSLPTASGYTVGEGLRRVGGDPDHLERARRPPGSIAAFLELHVEQGGVLDAAHIDIGVVEGIVGIERWNVRVLGRANHAGTTPMDQRHDALVAASRFVDAVYRTARDGAGGQVATVGRITVEPGAPNVIPGLAILSLEIRDLTMEGIDSLFEQLSKRAAGIGDDTGTTFSFERFYVSDAAPSDPRIRDAVEASAHELGLSTLRLPSGAGHDAQSMARLGPVGMIFVPSIGGISHSPEERTAPDDIVHGADVLLSTLLTLDAGAIDR